MFLTAHWRVEETNDGEKQGRQFHAASKLACNRRDDKDENGAMRSTALRKFCCHRRVTITICRAMDSPPPEPPEIKTCRNCEREIQNDGLTCPHCGAPCGPQSTGYEWKSRGTWAGQPLVHIAFGCDETGRPRTARGIVAIGQRAVGVVACGIIAGGMFSIGFVAIGFFSLGVVSIALGCAVGLNAIGPVAIGVTAVGAVAGGLAPFGSRILFTTPPIAP